MITATLVQVALAVVQTSDGNHRDDAGAALVTVAHDVTALVTPRGTDREWFDLWPHPYAANRGAFRRRE